MPNHPSSSAPARHGLWRVDGQCPWQHVFEDPLQAQSQLAILLGLFVARNRLLRSANNRRSHHLENRCERNGLHWTLTRSNYLPGHVHPPAWIPSSIQNSDRHVANRFLEPHREPVPAILGRKQRKGGTNAGAFADLRTVALEPGEWRFGESVVQWLQSKPRSLR